MKWFVFTGGDGALWYARPFYNDTVRTRKPEYQDIKVPVLSGEETTVTREGITVTLGTTIVNGESIWAISDDEWLQRYLNKMIVDPNIPLTRATPIHIVEHTDVPGDHPCCQGGIRCELRNAWEWTGKVSVNMPKARAIHMDRIRAVRNKQLADLDVPFMRAVEVGDASEQARVASEKQVLRDIPQTLDLTTDTPEQLKAKWPTELPARE